MNHKTGLRSHLAMLVCIVAVSAPLASSEKRIKPLSREEVAQAWVGISEDALYALRLVLGSDGTGRGAYVFAVNPAQVFEVTSWKYDPTKMTMVASLVDRSQDNIKSLDGTVVGRAMELTMRGEGWKRKYSLRPECDLQPKWQKLKDAMPDSRRSMATEPGRDSAPGLHLIADPKSPTFRSTQDVSLRIVLSNGGPECHPVLLDPAFSLERSGPRPFVKLNVTVRRLDGQPLQNSDRVRVMTKGISADEFFVLDCGGLIGADLRPSQADWPVRFAPGRYGVEVSAELTNRSFVSKRPDMMSSLSKRLKKSPGVIGWLLAEETVVAPPVEFEVQGPP